MALALGWNTFTNLSIQAATVIEQPYSYECALQSNCTHPGAGIDLAIFEYIADLIGLKYSLVETIDGKWGNNFTGSWSGIIGMTVRGDVMATANTVIHEEDRATDLYMTIPVYYEERGWAILTRNPNSLTFIAAKPFAWQVWIGCIFFFIITSLVMSLIHLKFQNKKLPWQTLSEEVWKLYGESLQQASNYSCERASPSLLIMFYRWYLITVLSYYGASLITSLMVNRPFQPFTTIHELAQLISNKEYTFLTETIVELQELQKIESFRNALEINPPRLVEDENEAVQVLISKPGFVYMGTLRYLMDNVRHHCNISIITIDKMDFTEQVNVFAFHKSELGRQLMQEFNRQISLIGTILDQLTQRYVSRNYCKLDQVDNAPINFSQIKSVIFVFLCGYPAALCVIVVEKLCHRISYTKARIKQQQSNNLHHEDNCVDVAAV